jgi:hypothetical protein
VQGFGEETGMRGLANKLGLNFVGSPASQAYRDEVGVPDVPLLRDVHDDEVVDLMYGRLQGLNTQLFNLALREYRPDPARTRRSCVAFTFVADFPEVRIGPHSPMSRLRASANWKHYRTVPPEFKERFDLQAPEPARAELLLSSSLTTWLRHQRSDLRIEISGGALLGHVAEVSDAEFLDLADLVRGVHARLADDAWAEFSVFGDLGG